VERVKADLQPKIRRVVRAHLRDVVEAAQALGVAPHELAGLLGDVVDAPDDALDEESRSAKVISLGTAWPAGTALGCCASECVTDLHRRLLRSTRAMTDDMCFHLVKASVIPEECGKHHDACQRFRGIRDRRGLARGISDAHSN